MAGAILAGTFNAFAFAGAGYIFSKINKGGYEKENNVLIKEMLSRKEINRRYYESHKDELKEKRKNQFLEKKKQMLMDKMNNIDFVEKNVYLEKMGGYEMNEYCEKRKKKFCLKYDIDHLNEREKGDNEKYFKEKKEAYQKYCIEMDAKYRIEKFRLFRNSYLKKMGKEPNLTAMVVNENIIPEEINPDSENYNKNLLSLLNEKDGDEVVEIKQVSDITSDDDED